MTTPAHPQEEVCNHFEPCHKLHGTWSYNCCHTEGIKEINCQYDTRSRSHSSVQSRDQVLDEAIGLLKDQLLWDIPHVMSYGIEHSIQTLEKLRTQGSRDP